jgi:hypothetical protein
MLNPSLIIKTESISNGLCLFSAVVHLFADDLQKAFA